MTNRTIRVELGSLFRRHVHVDELVSLLHSVQDGLVGLGSLPGVVGPRRRLGR